MSKHIPIWLLNGKTLSSLYSKVIPKTKQLNKGQFSNMFNFMPSVSRVFFFGNQLSFQLYSTQKYFASLIMSFVKLRQLLTDYMYIPQVQIYKIFEHKIVNISYLF